MSGQSISQENNQYNARVNKVLLNMARFIPIVMLSYGLLVNFKILEGSDLYSWQALLALITMLAIAGLTQDDGFEQSTVQQLSYLLIFLGFSVFVVGMDSIIVYWAPLCMTTVLNFGGRSYWWSCLLLLIFGLIDGIIHLPTDGTLYLIDGLIRVALITVASYIVIAITMALMTDRENLIKTKKRENTQFQRIQALIHSMNESIISLSANGIVQLYNAASLSLLDTNKSIKSLKIDDVFNLHDKNNEKVSIYETISNNGRLIERDDLTHTLPGGEKIRLSITSSPIRASYGKAIGRRQGSILIVRDITVSKSIEEERDEFISVISHELRTPVAITEASLSNMQLIARKEKASVNISNGLDDAHDQVIYLAKMVNDLASLSRAEDNDRTSTESIDVKLMIQNMYKEYAPDARASKLLLDIDVSPDVGIINTNRLYLEEMLQNLITNAIKYTQQGSITIEVKNTKSGMNFFVRDTGLGIAKSEKDKVFEKFYRSEDYRTRETSGSGLGLYIAQKLAARLNTKIELVSRLHHGSEFSFLIK